MNLPSLPAPANEALAGFTQQLSASLGQNLISILVYGGVARGRFDPAHSDINLLLILREVSLEALDHIASATTTARLHLKLSLMTLAQSDLPDCLEAFATKFLDIKHNHQVLFGVDLAANFEISPERLARQARRELANLQLRLRNTYLESARRPELLESHLQRGATALFINVAVLIEIKTGVHHETFAEIATAAAAIGLDPGVLRELRALRRQPGAPFEPKPFCRQIFAQLEIALRVASSL